MTIKTEFNSWFVTPKGPTLSAPPKAGDAAPTSPTLRLQAGRPSIVAFLRHCGCPFSEKTYLNLRAAAKQHPDVDFVAVSHSDEAATNKWLRSIPQDPSEPENLRMVVDADKEAYAAWGLGPSSIFHVMNPTSLVAVIKLSAKGGISARPTESGSRWQTSGHYAVAGDGVIRWGGRAARADDMINLDEALEALNEGAAKA